MNNNDIPDVLKQALRNYVFANAPHINNDNPTKEQEQELFNWLACDLGLNKLLKENNMAEEFYEDLGEVGDELNLT